MRSVAVGQRLPIAFLAAVMLQAAIALWWVAQQGSMLRFHQDRLDVIEAQQATSDRQQTMLQIRLARMEERQVAAAAILQDIRTQLQKHP